jgi:hypothetical protein
MYPDQAYEPWYLAYELGFISADDLKSDPAEISGDTHCYKFVSKYLSSRVLIKYDPTQNTP